MENSIKQVILDVLDYLRYQVVNDKCTPEELRNIKDNFVDNLEMDATIKDIAKFYGKSENDVSTVISRRMSKPKRRVMYNFSWFTRVMPKTWKRAATSDC